MDIFGPNAEYQSCTLILVITDAFSKYVALGALQNKLAMTIAKTFFAEWICKFGAPESIVSDNGKEFCNAVVDNLLTCLGTKHKQTTTYHPQTNGQAKIFNKTITRYLCLYTEQNTQSWVDMLPAMAFMHNSAIHAATQTTPNSLKLEF